jgi:hypothetical protein
MSSILLSLACTYSCSSNFTYYRVWSVPTQDQCISWTENRNRWIGDQLIAKRLPSQATWVKQRNADSNPRPESDCNPQLQRPPDLNPRIASERRHKNRLLLEAFSKIFLTLYHAEIFRRKSFFCSVLSKQHNCKRAVCKVRGLTLLLRVELCRGAVTVSFSKYLPPLASDALLTTLHLLLENGVTVVLIEPFLGWRSNLSGASALRD